MESFFRYISYIDYYRKGEKIKNVGFLRWKLHNGEHLIEIQLKDIFNEQGEFYIKEQNTGKRIGEILIDKGIGNFKKKYPSLSSSGENYIDTLDGRLYTKDVEALVIRLNSNDYLNVSINFELEQEKKMSSEIVGEQEFRTKNVIKH